MKRLTALFAIFAFFLPPAAFGQPRTGTENKVAVGTLGPYDIGVNLTEQDNARVVAAHYFYATTLQDIPLVPSMEGEVLVLREPGGGVFRLRTVDKNLRPMKSFDLWRSLGFSGTWTKDGRTLPVALGGGYSGLQPDASRWYSQVTDESDAAFEGRVRRLLKGVLTGDREAAAREVAYPMHANLSSGRTLIIRNRREFLARFDQVFTPKLAARLRHAIAHEMFVHNGEAMLLDGELWFTDKGLTGVNQP